MPAARKSIDRYKSMAHYFGSVVRNLRDTYEIRVGDPLTIAQLAERTGYSTSMIGAIERGASLPESGSRVQAIDDALHAGGQLRSMWPLVQRFGHYPIDELAAATNLTLGGYREGRTNSFSPGDDVERRVLFQLAGLGLLAQTPINSGNEPVRQMLDRALGVTEGHTVEHWQLVCAEHLNAVLHQPPATTRTDLVIDLVALQQAITRAAPERVADLQRLGAWLSALHANLLTRLGEHGSARRWWTTARHAADASGDTDMRVWVRGTEAVFGLYSPRAPEALLTLSRTAQTLAGDRVTSGLMKAVSAEAQALAALGRHQEAHEKVRHLLELAEREVVGERYGWTGHGVWFTASWVYAYNGGLDSGRDARDRLLATSPCYQNEANVRLHEALTIGVQGGHDEGLRLATEVISDLDPAYRSRMILNTAHRVLTAIPREKRAALPALSDYRATVSAPVLT
jgi:transcriptional regulator with XRE-family HTH domain